MAFLTNDMIREIQGIADAYAKREKARLAGLPDTSPAARQDVSPHQLARSPQDMP